MLYISGFGIAGSLGGPAGVGAAVGVETVGIGLGAWQNRDEGGVATVGGAGGVAGLTCFGALAAFSAFSTADFS